MVKIFELKKDLKSKDKDSNLLALLSYVFGAIVAAIAYLASRDKKDKALNFCLIQALSIDIALFAIALPLVIFAFIGHFLAIILSLFTFGASLLIWVPIFLLIWLILVSLMLSSFILKIYLAYNIYNGKIYSVVFLERYFSKYV